MTLLPQFRLVLPLDANPHEAWMHARARLAGKTLAEKFHILRVVPGETGKFQTKNGTVHGRQFHVILRPNDPEEFQGGKVVYEHPDYEKLVH